MLLAMPAAHGLFHKAIIQSGPGLRAVPRDRATALAKALLDELKITDAAALQAAPGDVIAETEYGGAIAAMIGRDNMVGTQFHPEKSQAVGLQLLQNFARWRP